MQKLTFLSLTLFFGATFSNHPEFIDPTGTYLLKGEIKNSKIIGHYGELRVRLLDTNSVALCFYVNKGSPGYESGSLMDTLQYEDNRVGYKPSNDSSCVIYFAFHNKSVEIFQMVTDPHSGCGFSPGVMTAAVLEKTSSDVPVIQDLSARGE